MKRMLIGFLFVMLLLSSVGYANEPSATANKMESLSEGGSGSDSELSPDIEAPTYWEDLLQRLEKIKKASEEFRVESAKELVDSQKIVADLRPALRFKKDATQKGVTLVHDNATPTTYRNGAFYVYLGDRGEYTWPRVVLKSLTPKRLLIRSAIFDIDDETFSIDVKSSKDRKQTFRTIEIYAGKTMMGENIDIEMTPEIRDILERVAKSKKTIMYLQGDYHNTKSIITTTQKEAIDRVLRYYDAKVYVNIYG